MNSVLQVAQLLFSLAPEVIKAVENAIPLAQNIVNAIKAPDGAVTQDQWDAIHSQIAALTADIEQPEA